jgi:phage/plasmid-associated DNA primase
MGEKVQLAESILQQINISDVDSYFAEILQDKNYISLKRENNMLKSLTQWLEQFKPKELHDPNINIIDISCGGYVIPPENIKEFFIRLESINRSGLITKFMERQYFGNMTQSSGIFIDYDIYYQDSQPSNEELKNICQMIATDICELLHELFDLSEYFAMNKNVVNVIFLRKSKPTYKVISNINYINDGLHVLIPGIQLLKNEKKFFITQLKTRDNISKILDYYSYKRAPNEVLDINCAHVPSYFIGSTRNLDNPSYELFYAINAKYNHIKNMFESLTNETISYTNENIVIVHELSLNFYNQDGIIYKSPIRLKQDFVQMLPNVEHQDEFHEIEMLCVNYPEAKSIREFLSILNIYRAETYTEWFRVMCALASDPKLKPLAREFSMKSKQYNDAEFEKLWNRLILDKKSNGLTTNSIYYWAKQDNPKAFAILQKKSIKHQLSDILFRPIIAGKLTQFNVVELLYHQFSSRYSTDVNGKSYQWFEFKTKDNSTEHGDIYKWSPISEPEYLKTYIAKEIGIVHLTELFNIIKQKIKTTDNEIFAAYLKKLADNIEMSFSQLGSISFAESVIRWANIKFRRPNFIKNLDKAPNIMGVGNGVLEFGNGTVKFINTEHEHKISLYTSVDYEPFNPKDPKTIKVLRNLRNCFADDEWDAFDWYIYYLSTSLLGDIKKPIFVIKYGQGLNGKSIYAETVRNIFGQYGKKINVDIITKSFAKGDTASPTKLGMINKRIITYSEPDKTIVLNEPFIKETTGGETQSDRPLYGTPIDYTLVCNQVLPTNWYPVITSNDYGFWRRIYVVPFRMQFFATHKKEYDPNNPYHKPASKEVEGYPQNEEAKKIILSIFVFYWQNLYFRYNGDVTKVPHPTIQKETQLYKSRQNIIERFISTKIIVDEPERKLYMSELVHGFKQWQQAQGDTTTVAMNIRDFFSNSRMAIYKKQDKLEEYFTGMRLLGAHITYNPKEHTLFFQREDEKPNNRYAKTESFDQYMDRITKMHDELQSLLNQENYERDEKEELLLEEKYEAKKDHSATKAQYEKYMQEMKERDLQRVNLIKNQNDAINKIANSDMKYPSIDTMHNIMNGDDYIVHIFEKNNQIMREDMELFDESDDIILPQSDSLANIPLFHQSFSLPRNFNALPN